MNSRFRVEPLAARSTTRLARNVMVALLISFLVVTAMVLAWGEFGSISQPLRLGSPTYREFKAEANERLSTYGWMDRQTNTVHIPIDRAIDLTVERGLPTRP